MTYSKKVKNISLSHSGFSLIEIMVVLAIISILAVLVLPSNEGEINRVKIQESLDLVESYKADIVAYYHLTGEFPIDNEMASIPARSQIVGNYLSQTELRDGAFHLQLGNKINRSLLGLIVSVRPVFVPGVPNAPVSWVCGYDTIPAGMVVAGENLTSVGKIDLPIKCR